MGSNSITGDMQQFIWNTGMMDLGFVGNLYTWSNGREGQGRIMERLDRGMANGDWRALFPRATVTHLTRFVVDHAPILLDSLGDRDHHPKPFRFEAFWAEDGRSIQVENEA